MDSLYQTLMARLHGEPFGKITGDLSRFVARVENCIAKNRGEINSNVARIHSLEQVNKELFRDSVKAQALVDEIKSFMARNKLPPSEGN